MPTSNEKFLVGLVGPKVLEAIEQDSLNPVFLDLQACNALEIRYDFFDTALWPKLSERLRKVAPHAIQTTASRNSRTSRKRLRCAARASSFRSTTLFEFRATRS